MKEDKLYKVTIKQDGSISYKGNTYNSPSLTAFAITSRAVNGWLSWKYQQAPGEWVLLDNLRTQ
jgi:hypothetical protein